MFFSVSFCMIFATAISKSSWVTCTRRSRRAYMPAKVLSITQLKFLTLRQKLIYQLQCSNWKIFVPNKRIYILHLHNQISKLTCFSASSLDFSTWAPTHLLGDFPQVNPPDEICICICICICRQKTTSPCQVHFSGVNFEDVKTSVLIRRWEFNFPELHHSQSIEVIRTFSAWWWNWFINETYQCDQDGGGQNRGCRSCSLPWSPKT